MQRELTPTEQAAYKVFQHALDGGFNIPSAILRMQTQFPETTFSSAFLKWLM